MGRESNSLKFSDAITCEIPLKLPSLNEYVNACRKNKYGGASMKKRIESDIIPYIAKLPRLNYPVTIDFLWIEDSRRRDYDNVAFSKKFILDAMVKAGKLKDDNRKCVKGFTDTFGYERYSPKVILTIHDARFSMMQKACDRRKIDTGGECERMDCEGLGWCKYCLEVVK